MKSWVGQQLIDKAELFDKKNMEYGSTYLKAGQIYEAIFPDGICLNSAQDFGRFAIFVLMMTKVNRYAQNFEKGGHEDSLDDLSVYAMMLKEIDNES